MPRLLIISHGHPELSPGGAERASYAIHSLIRRGALPGWDSIYLARVEQRAIGHDGELGVFRGRRDEVLIAPPLVDHFFMSSIEPARLFRMLDEMMEVYRPDVVHLHHFVYFGIEILGYFARRGIPMLFTFHEYMAICHNYGQMVKTNGRLCREASPAECHACFADHTSGMFFLRREMFVEQLKRATLTAPSDFLRRRIEDWSGGRLPVTVIENPRDLSTYDALDETRAADRDDRVVGYFGQLNHFKGTETLLKAMLLLKQRGVPVRLRLFGANLEMQDQKFQERTKAQIDELGESVEFFGPYDNAAVIRLMASCDAVVVPSIWWENSPVVLQEAMQAQVPIVGSRLGGIAEKIRDYASAILFEPGSATDLADKLAGLASGRPQRSPDIDAGADKTSEDAWEALTGLYRNLNNARHDGDTRHVEFHANPKGSGKVRRRVRRQADVQAGGRRRAPQLDSAVDPGR